LGNGKNVLEEGKRQWKEIKTKEVVKMAPNEIETPATLKRRYARRKASAGVEQGPLENGLEDEIRMIRLIIRRVLNLADEGRSLDEVLKVLDTVGRASTRLAGLLKAADALDKKQGLAAALSQAISEVTEELKLN
jgi:hypothetical protein